MEISSFQSYLIILFVVLIIISIFVFRQFLKTRSEEFNLVKFEQKGLESLTQATELYEFGSIQIKKRLYPEATKTFLKAIENNEILNYELVDNYREIAKLVKEARIKQNLTIQELSRISKIPEQTINSIENNTKSIRPKFPFIRSILIKLEECLILKKNTLVKLATRERENFKKEKPNFLIRKFDLINTWQGTLFYFFILVFTVFILKRYFILNVHIIEIQNIENKKIEK